MADVRTISQQIRFLFTALTLCCVLLLNNQEITTYQLVSQSPVSPATNQLHKAAKKSQTAVKRKVSFEATTSYLILQIAYFNNWLRPVFNSAQTDIPKFLLKTSQARSIFGVLSAFTIVPNAP